MSKLISLVIDGKGVEVESGLSIVEAAKGVSVSIPTLCYHPDIKPSGSCGICVVDIEGYRDPQRACSTIVEQGMNITTNSKRIRDTRKIILEMILADHDVDCPTCLANNKCTLQDLSSNFSVTGNSIPKNFKRLPLDETSPSIVIDQNRCINCGRCVEMCQGIQTVNALATIARGHKAVAGVSHDAGLGNTVCVNCGQCTVVCPVGALVEKSEIDLVFDALLDPTKHVIVQQAPAVRVALAEEFGMEKGLATPGKMYAALEQLGFDKIFDTNFSADLTIMEEGTEFITRVKEGGNLPIITSCCPSWIKFSETFFPNMVPYLSTCKSPQQMFGTLSKSYYSEHSKIDAKDIVSVSIMPCTGKKFEARRPEMADSGYQDVDYVLTTREFIRMIREAGIDFKNIDPIEHDSFMGDYTGAGTIFGASGGVVEAAVRTAYFVLAGKNLPAPELKALRTGVNELNEVTLEAEGLPFPLKIAVANGLGNTRRLMDKITKQIEETGKSDYHIVEIMACPGGCAGGGGQPFDCDFNDRSIRGEGLYTEDAQMDVRYSHENKMVQKAYEDFLGSPNSEKAHKLLHTNYYKRDGVTGHVIEELTHKH